MLCFSVRVLPHHQNTGGFFLAVFEKTRQVDWFKGVGEQRAEGERMIIFYPLENTLDLK